MADEQTQGTAGDFLSAIQAAGAPPQPAPPPMERPQFTGPAARFLNSIQYLDQPDEMAAARGRQASATGEEGGFYALRRSVPFVSVGVNVADQLELRKSKDRVKEGTATSEDYDWIAKMERRDAINAKRSTAGQIGSALARVPAIAGEAAITGPVAGGIAARLGFKAAQEAAAPTAAFLSREGLKQAAIAQARAAPQAIAQTPLMPSLYAEEAMRQADRKGGSPVEYLPRSLALAAVQNVVLGTIGKTAGQVGGEGVKGFLARQGTRAATGVAEQTILDAATGAAQRAYDGSKDFDAGYGTLGELYEGKYGAAAKNLAVQAATFAAFGAMHAGEDARAAKRPVQALAEATKAMSDAGIPPDQAAQHINIVAAPLHEAIKSDPGLTRAEAEKIAEKAPEGPAGDYVRAVAESLPEKAPEPPPETPREKIDRLTPLAQEARKRLNDAIVTEKFAGQRAALLNAGSEAAKAAAEAKERLKAAKSESRDLDKQLNAARDEVNKQPQTPQGEAKPPVWERTPADLAASGYKSFETAKGSHYFVGPDGRTQRVKAPRFGHTNDDLGVKQPSDATVYVSPEDAQKIGMWQSSSAMNKRLVVRGDQAQLTSKVSEAHPQGADGPPIKLHDSPAVGLSPLELWGKSDQFGGSWRGSHPGSPISRFTDVAETHRIFKDAAGKAPKTPQAAAEPEKAPEARPAGEVAAAVKPEPPEVRLKKIHSGKNIHGEPLDLFLVYDKSGKQVAEAHIYPTGQPAKKEPGDIHIEFMGRPGSSPSDPSGGVGATLNRAITNAIIAEYPKASQVTGYRESGARSLEQLKRKGKIPAGLTPAEEIEAARPHQWTRLKIEGRTQPELPPETPIDKEDPFAFLDKYGITKEPAKSEVQTGTLQFSSSQAPPEPALKLSPLERQRQLQAQREAAPRAPATPLTPVEKKAAETKAESDFTEGRTNDPAALFEAKGLTPREQHVLMEREAGRTHAEIAADPQMAKEDGTALTRQRVKQIEDKARDKAGLEGTAEDENRAKRQDALHDLAEKGKLINLREFYADPAGTGRAISKLTAEYVHQDRLADDVAARWLAEKQAGKMTPERDKEYERELHEILSRQQAARSGREGPFGRGGEGPAEPGERAPVRQPAGGELPAGRGEPAVPTPDEASGGVRPQEAAQGGRETAGNAQGDRGAVPPAAAGSRPAGGDVVTPPTGPAFPPSPAQQEAARGGIPGEPGGWQGAAPPRPGREFAHARERVTEERAERGQQAVADAVKRANPQAWADATALLSRDPNAADALVASLRAQPRPLTSTELATLLLRRIALANEHYGAIRDYNEAASRSGPTVPFVEPLRRRADDLEAARNRLDEAVAGAGTELGRGLQFFRQLAREDYTLGRMLASAQKAKGAPLTEAEQKDIRERHRQIREADDRLQRAEGGDQPAAEPGHPGDLTDLRVGARRARRAFGESLNTLAASTRTTPQRVFHAVGETLNAARSLVTAFDLSAVFRQGGFFTFGRPLTAARAFPDMLRSFASEHAFDRANEELNQRPNAVLYQRSGLHLADYAGPVTAQEEAFVGRLARTLPVLGRGIAASERAYVAFLNRVRADVFDSLTASLPRGGRPTDAEARALANFVNIATGRGNLGPLERAAVPMAQLFFSPRYVASRFQLLAGQPLYGGSNRTRQLVAQEYARALAGLATFYAIAAASSKDTEITFDPRSSDFGKVKFGNFRLDPLAGLAQATVFPTRLVSGETKSTNKSSPEDIRGKTFGLRPQLSHSRDTAGDVIFRFLRSKLAPIPSVVVDAMEGKTITGDKVTAQHEAGQVGMPMAVRDVWDALKDQGVPRGVALSLLAILGMSTNLHDRPAKAG